MIDYLRVGPGAQPGLVARSPEDTLGLESKEGARERRTELVDRQGAMQERLFDEYLVAWDDLIGETSTEWSPWHVVPADRHWGKSTAVAALLVDALERLDPKFPDADPGIEGLTVT